MSETTGDEVRLPRSIKQLRSSAKVKAYQKEWFHKIREGEYGICGADEAEEIFTAFGMPVVVVPWWMAIIAAKRMSSYYGNILAERGYDMGHYAGSLGLAVTIDNNPETAPWGGLPRPAVMIGSTNADQNLTMKEIWAREYGCPCFPLEGGGLPFRVPPRWWERIRDHWDEMIDPRTLDFRVQQYKELIRFLEITTGRRFSLARLAEVNELINEQEDYWRKARDLIAKTVPCPVSAPDQFSVYPAQWFRGTPEGRDLIKAFYEEVKERVDNGVAACPNEKIRLKFAGPLWGNTAFFQYFEEKYDAVFVDSTYTSIAADCLARTTLNGDPLRTIAGRNVMLSGDEVDGGEHSVWVAKLHKCDGVVGFREGGGARRPQMKAFEKAGIPTCEIPGNVVDLRQWKDEEAKAIVSNFIEKRILPNKKI
jgi:hypothetical protein